MHPARLHYDSGRGYCTSGKPKIGCWWCWTCFMMFENQCRNAEKKFVRWAFLPAVTCVSPASAFRHKDQSGTAGSGLVWHCPAMYFCTLYLYTYVMYTTKRKKFLRPGINTVIGIKHAWSKWSPTHQPDLFWVLQIIYGVAHAFYLPNLNTVLMYDSKSP